MNRNEIVSFLKELFSNFPQLSRDVWSLSSVPFQSFEDEGRAQQAHQVDEDDFDQAGFDLFRQERNGGIRGGLILNKDLQETRRAKRGPSKVLQDFHRH